MIHTVALHYLLAINVVSVPEPDIEETACLLKSKAAILQKDIENVRILLQIT